ncbi:MAG: AbrB/MazE/SpoVT family DNA-binding domain-containing protein [bacterium]|nr:AbrB/MazE/SpoVT family DNA-binding domain-containing protein [bacterium]
MTFSQPIDSKSEWLKVLGKGMVTIPISWRKELNIKPGDMVKAKKEGDRVFIEAPMQKTAPYRTYSDAEIAQFIKDDTL